MACQWRADPHRRGWPTGTIVLHAVLSDVQWLASIDEFVVECGERELEAVRHAKLVEDIRDVVLDRVLADRELPRDVLVRQPAHDGGDDLLLARRQPEFAFLR